MEQDKFAVFERWLLENGAKFPKLELRVQSFLTDDNHLVNTPLIVVVQDYGYEVRGCHSIADIQMDEIVVEVPLKCLITVEMGKATEVYTLPFLRDAALTIYSLVDWTHCSAVAY